LTVSEINSCNYCLSAHTYIGANLVKIDAETLDAARNADATNTKNVASKQNNLKLSLVDDSDDYHLPCKAFNKQE